MLMRTSSIRFVYLAVGASPFLAQYAGLGSSLLLNDVVLLITFPILIIFLKVHLSLFSFLVVVVSMFFSASVRFIEDFDSTSLMRVLRVAFYFIYIFLLASSFREGDRKFIRKCILTVASLVAIFVCLQSTAGVFLNFYPGFYLPWPDLSRPEIYEHLRQAESAYVRPRGGLGEPSQVGLFLGLVLVFYGTTEVVAKSVRALIVTALLLSFSLTGYALLAIHVCLFCFAKFGEARGKARLAGLVSLLVFLIACGVFFFLNYERIVRRLLNRLRTEFWPSFEASEIFFGSGYGSELMTVWLASGVRFFYSFGAVGTVLTLFALLAVHQKAKFRSPILACCLFCFVSMFTEVAVSYWLIVWCLIVLGCTRRPNLYRRVSTRSY